MTDKRRNGRWAKWARTSVILHLLRRIADAVFGASEHSLSAHLLGETGEGAPRKVGRPGVFAWLFSKLYQNVIRPGQYLFIRNLDHGAFRHALDALTDRLLYDSVSAYSNFFLCFGLYASGALLISHFLLNRGELAVAQLVLTVTVVLLALLMRSAGGSMAQNLAKGRITSFLIFTVMGFRRERFDANPVGTSHNGIAIVTGTLLGLLTFFVLPSRVLLGLLVLLLCCVVFAMPEFGVVLLFFFIPLASLLSAPSVSAGAAVAYVIFCYLCKLIRGKRSFAFHTIDGAVLLFAAFTLQSGLVSVGQEGTRAGMLQCCMVCGYFLCANLMTSRPAVRRAVGALSCSLLVVSVYGIYQYITGDISTLWLDTAMFGDIAGRVTSLFDNPNVLGEFLILGIFAALGLLAGDRNRPTRIFTTVSLLSGILCLVLTWSRGAWLGALCAFVIFLFMMSRYAAAGVVCFGLTAPAWIAMLPKKLVRRLLSIGNIADHSTSTRVEIWNTSTRLIRDHLLTGLGAGGVGFGQAFSQYAAASLTGVEHSHSLYLQLLIIHGIAGLALFVWIFALLTRRCVATARLPREQMSVRPCVGLCVGLYSGIAGLLIGGFSDYVWYNYRICAMMWLVLGLAVACARLSAREAEAYVPGPVGLSRTAITPAPRHTV